MSRADPTAAGPAGERRRVGSAAPHAAPRHPPDAPPAGSRARTLVSRPLCLGLSFTTPLVWGDQARQQGRGVPVVRHRGHPEGTRACRLRHAGPQRRVLSRSEGSPPSILGEDDQGRTRDDGEKGALKFLSTPSWANIYPPSRRRALHLERYHCSPHPTCCQMPGRGRHQSPLYLVPGSRSRNPSSPVEPPSW